jgi:hypothetical protein
MCDVGSAGLYYTGLFRGLREKQGRSRAVPRGVFTYSPTTLKGMSYKLMYFKVRVVEGTHIYVNGRLLVDLRNNVLLETHFTKQLQKFNLKLN